MKNILRRLHLHDDASDCTKPSPKPRISLPDAASELFSIAKNTLISTSTSLRLGKDPPPPPPPPSSSPTLAHHDHCDAHVPELEQQHHAAMDAMAAAACTTSPLAAVLALDSRNSQTPDDPVLQDPPAHGSVISLERSNTAVLQLVSDQALLLQDEDLQVQVAMALSVRDDPEAAAIEAAKDLTTPPPNNSTAELLAFQYWKSNVLNYEDKVLDGFYDVYGITSTSDSSLEMMPTLINLEEAPISSKMTYEVVLVNRVTDNDLVSLEQKAISMSLSSRLSMASRVKENDLIQRIANMVADRMGGAVTDSDTLLRYWVTSSAELRLSLGKKVLPLGHLQIGLARHRALLFKVLADAVGVPCKLVKGRQFTGNDKAAVNIIMIDTREYVVDLMGSPGRLLSYDSGFNSDQQTLIPCTASHTRDCDLISSRNVILGDKRENLGDGPMPRKAVAGAKVYERKGMECHGNEQEEPNAIPAIPMVSRYVSHWRSPSWTEGMQDSKEKDVSQYMIDVAKENPKLARKICDILLEGGVQVPSELSKNIHMKEVQSLLVEEKNTSGEKQKSYAEKEDQTKNEKNNMAPGKPPSPLSERAKDRLQRLNSVQGLGDRRPLDPSVSTSPNSSGSVSASVQSSVPALPVTLGQENLPPELIKKVPVAAAAAAATAAVVASSMVVAASKSDFVSDQKLEVPVAAAAVTATAAVVVATSAVVGKHIDLCFSESVDEENSRKSHEEITSDKSSESISSKSVGLLDDVAEWEIPWEELIIGERIGLGSYGEVYHGEWHGTEVAIKKFIEQDISGDALEEFRSEVRLMKRMRHPNVVLFMGAVMRAPNMSIVTEFLPRGSLYRLIHRSNSQLDERRRMRMALDVARGMNYLHTSTPVIVHRDLKSPNLLVDKNWVVKVCDFGLSRMKHNTFLSSKSTAGTPEWMAPEVLRNEPSNEKSDVYSFGVILWELATLQQPWAGMNPMQVVGAVGFQDRTLEIPEDLDPAITTIIRQCWQDDPGARPSFAEIMHALKPLQKPPTPQIVKT